MRATQPSNYYKSAKPSQMDSKEARKVSMTYSSSPLDTHSIEHVRREEREYTTAQRTHERVTCDSGSCEHEIRVDDVVQQAQKDSEDAKAGEESREYRDDPVHVAGVS